MGSVIIVFRILPDGPGSLDSVKKELKMLKAERLEEDPIGFGLSALKATFVIPDTGGAQDELENRLSGIKGVNGVETIAVSRSL